MSYFFPRLPLVKKIHTLIMGRLVLTFLLLLASWWWTNNYLQTPGEIFPVHLFYLFISSFFLTIVYLVYLRFNQDYLWQVRIQLFVDILLVTALVWGTGDLISPYITLYVLLISVAGLFLNNRETLVVAGLCTICFTLIPVLTFQNFIFSLSTAESPSRSLQIIAFNNVAMLVVGLLSARISERQKISEQLKQTTESFADLHILHERIVESIRSGLITTDLAGKIYDFNPAAQDITGIPTEEMLGESVFLLLGEKIRTQVDLCLQNSGSSETIFENFEAKVLTKQGKSITISCTVTPLVGKIGQVYGLIFSFQDITRLKQMEESLRRSDRLAAVGRMAAGLAHEIRNPLGSMDSALQFLHERMPPRTTEASLMEVVLRESERLNNIITNFLVYARPSADVFSSSEQVEIDLDEVIRDCLVLLSHSPEIKAEHSLEYQPPPTPAPRLKANETQIKQVFWNLAKNAIQAMPEGGILQIELRQKNNDCLSIIFSDTGAGIPAEKLEHIFEPFSGQTRGSGLGLSIVHKIISDHRGQIKIDSTPGSGTRIVIDLPLDN